MNWTHYATSGWSNPEKPGITRKLAQTEWVMRKRKLPFEGLCSHVAIAVWS